jgi:hypothetical protein
MTLAVWTAEWTQAIRRKRVLAFSVTVPLALVVSVGWGGAPAPHAALVYTVLFTFFATFGAAVPWARDAERGFLTRVRLTGMNPAAIVGQRLIAAAAIDLVELLPSLAAIALIHDADGSETVRLLLWVGLGLVTANGLGILVAAWASSLAETALAASVAALLLLHAGGVFRTPEPGSGAARLERAIPFHYMHQAVSRAAGAP